MSVRSSVLDPIGQNLRLHGPRRLLLAVLHEAIGTFQMNAAARDRRGRTAFAQAAAWFACDDTDDVFSFMSVCDALGIDASYVRVGLQRWLDGHDAALAGAYLQSSPRPWAGPERENPVPSPACRGNGG